MLGNVSRETGVTVAMVNPGHDISLVDEWDIRSAPTLVLVEDREASKTPQADGDSAERSRSRDGDAVSRDDENSRGEFSNHSAERSSGQSPREEAVDGEEVGRLAEGFQCGDVRKTTKSSSAAHQNASRSEDDIEAFLDEHLD